MVIIVKLYLQRDTSDINARYQISDEKGNLKYTVTGKRNPSGESVRIRDLAGESVCRIRSIGFSALSIYSISAGDESIRLNIAVSGNAAAVRFRGISFYIRGDAMLGSYSILDADTAVVCEVGKDFAKGCVQTEIFQEDRELFCLASIICIDSLTAASEPALQMT